MACHCNILKNLLRTVDKGRFSSFGVEFSANNFTPPKTSCYELLHGACDLVGFCEHGNEVSGSINGRAFRD